MPDSKYNLNNNQRNKKTETEEGCCKMRFPNNLPFNGKNNPKYDASSNKLSHWKKKKSLPDVTYERYKIMHANKLNRGTRPSMSMQALTIPISNNTISAASLFTNQCTVGNFNNET